MRILKHRHFYKTECHRRGTNNSPKPQLQNRPEQHGRNIPGLGVSGARGGQEGQSSPLQAHCKLFLSRSPLARIYRDWKISTGSSSPCSARGNLGIQWYSEQATALLSPPCRSGMLPACSFLTQGTCAKTIRGIKARGLGGVGLGRRFRIEIGCWGWGVQVYRSMTG